MITRHFQSIDMALAKRFAMPYSEHHALQFRLEAFDVFNHPVWGAPNGNILAGPAFLGGARQCRASGLRRHQHNGAPALPMRQIQPGLEYSF